LQALFDFFDDYTILNPRYNNPEKNPRQSASHPIRENQREAVPSPYQPEK